MKYEDAKKERNVRMLAAAIEHEDITKVEVNIQDITVDGSYKGPKLDESKDCDDIDAEWVKSLMEWQKD